MATHDVPGHNPSNNDELKAGCWAEHSDGSLIFVQSTEGGRIIYMMFDTLTDPITEYRDAMPEKGFKETFSWKNVNDIRWTWHDKTPQPWDRIIKSGAKDGLHFASADEQLSAAAKVARSLKLRSKKFQESSVDHLREKVTTGKTSNRVIRALQAAINELRS